MGELVVVSYVRAGGIDLQRAAQLATRRPSPVSNMALITGLHDSEPVVVIRGLDRYGHEALARYADSVVGIATDAELRALRVQLDDYDDWQRRNAHMLQIHVPGEANA